MYIYDSCIQKQTELVIFLSCYKPAIDKLTPLVNVSFSYYSQFQHFSEDFFDLWLYVRGNRVKLLRDLLSVVISTKAVVDFDPPMSHS